MRTRNYILFGIIIVVALAGAAAAQVRKDARVHLVRAKLTAYCTCSKCCEKYAAAKRTAMGTDARKPVGVASANWLVPLGSYVYVPVAGVANQYRIVDDTGGGMRKMARKGLLQFDIRFPSHRSALQFGTRWAEVYVYVEDETPLQEEFFASYAINSWEPSESCETPVQALKQVQEERLASLVAANK